MKKLLILGATGNLGKVVVAVALKKGYHIVALVRSPEKLGKHENLTIVSGDITDMKTLKEVINGVDAVISTLGHGFRTPFPIQEKTLSALIPVMKEAKVARIITITGSALLEPGDPPSLLGMILQTVATWGDPYRLSDAKKQAELLRESTLDWTVVRTPVHSSSDPSTLTSVGMKQPLLWQTVSRKAIATFMLLCIEQNIWIRKAPIITS